MNSTKVSDKYEHILSATIVMAEYILGHAPGGNSVHRHLIDILDKLKSEAAPVVEAVEEVVEKVKVLVEPKAVVVEPITKPTTVAPPAPPAPVVAAVAPAAVVKGTDSAPKPTN